MVSKDRKIGYIWMLFMESGSSSPVQRDLDILLRLHRFLILASCDWRHDELYNPLIDYL